VANLPMVFVAFGVETGDALSTRFGPLMRELLNLFRQPRIKRKGSRFCFSCALAELAGAWWKIVHACGGLRRKKLCIYNISGHERTFVPPVRRLKIFVSAVRFCPCPPNNAP
jgi:hypothetical protein